MLSELRLHSPMLPGAISSKAEKVFSVENTQPLLARPGRGLLVRICLFYVHTRVFIMQVCVYLYTHMHVHTHGQYRFLQLLGSQSLPSNCFWIPVLPAAGTGQTSPLQQLAQTVTHISRHVQKLLWHWLTFMGFRSVP